MCPRQKRLTGKQVGVEKGNKSSQVNLQGKRPEYGRGNKNGGETA